MEYARSKGITVQFIPASEVKTPEAKKTSEFEFSPVTDAKTSSSVPQQEKPEETKDPFDFSVLHPVELDNSEVNFIIDDIVDFRERNRLTTSSEIEGIPLRIRTTLAQTLYSKYATLVRLSDDINIWLSFLDEPLIRNCITYESFREWLLKVFDMDTIDKLNLIELLEKQSNEQKSDIHEIVADKDFEEKLRKEQFNKKLLLPIVICFSMSFLIIMANLAFLKQVHELTIILVLSLFVLCGIYTIVYVARDWDRQR